MSSFWERKLANPNAPIPPGATDTSSWQGFSPPSTALVHSLRPAAQITSPKAQSSRDNSRCPECNSGNYGRGVGPEATNIKARCYDCGYPLMQSGSGIAAPSTSGAPVKAAKQVASVTTAGYNPHIIVDRIGE